ncbi:hypothetical protein JTB14_015117 [Gonioctena quinquepunctata]|nr:hypothetical protein JTB14_015117 [Gonioctena quinquepunctata]
MNQLLLTLRFYASSEHMIQTAGFMNVQVSTGGRAGGELGGGWERAERREAREAGGGSWDELEERGQRSELESELGGGWGSGESWGELEEARLEERLESEAREELEERG